MDYILMNKNNQLIKKFSTQEEGIKYFDKLQNEWKECGVNYMPMKLFYNGFKAIMIKEVK